VDQQATLKLVPARRAPRLARAFAADTLEAWAVAAERIAAVQLVVSELVTNAVLHAPASRTITLELSMTDGGVRVMVSDESPQEPEQQDHQAPPTAEGGRGVEIVDAVADRWGTQFRPPAGKTVWCDLEAEPAPRT
jgi:anti-sigma regulatory factor (Ser/Thr protein kinase)